MSITKKDLTEALGDLKTDIIVGVGEVIEKQIIPQFDDINGKIETIQEDVSDIKEHIGTIENAFAMPVHLSFQRKQAKKRPIRRAS